MIITEPFNHPKSAISEIQKSFQRPVNFRNLKKGYNVTTDNIEDHETLKKLLSTNKIPFYTFSTKDKKPVKLIMKGVHHSYSTEGVKNDILVDNKNVSSVQAMFAKGNKQMDMFIVNFLQGTKIQDVMKSIKYICQQKVTWHRFIKKDSGTQCRKCQGFGHAAINCGLEYRCVKCPHRHGPGDCPLENDQPATCVNCKMNSEL